jgi:hypothetical protein
MCAKTGSPFESAGTKRNSFKMKKEPDPNVYKQMQRFAELTKELIRKGNISRAKNCLNKAEEIYGKGTAEIKNAIINVYVFSVSTFLEIHHCRIADFFPKSLQAAYYEQVNTSGL